MADCLGDALKKFPEADREAIKQLHDSMVSDQKQAFLNGLANPESVFREKSIQRLEDFKRSVVISQLKELENIKKNNIRNNRYDNPVFEQNKEGWESPKAAGVASLLDRTFQPMKGGAGGVFSRQMTYIERLATNFVLDLGGKDSPLLKIFKSGDLSKEAFLEHWDLANGGKGGVSSSEDALRIAKAMHNSDKAILGVLNSAGAYVHDLEGHMGTRTWDPELLKKFGNATTIAEAKANWVTAMIEAVNHDKSFNSGFANLDPKTTLGESFDRITSGKQDASVGSDSDQVIKIIDMPRNIAKQAERSRSYFFKSGEAAWDMLQKSSKLSPENQMMVSMRNAARSASLMEAFGTNPEASFQRDIRNLSTKDQDALYRLWHNVDGTTSLGGQDPYAQKVALTKMVAGGARLQNVIATKISEFANRANVDQLTTGKNYWQANYDSAISLFKNIPSEQKNNVAKLVDTGLGHAMSDLHLGTDGNANEMPRINKFYSKTMDMTGVGQFTEAGRTATKSVLSAALGMDSHLNFSELHPQAAKLLNQFNIGPVEWDVARFAAKDFDGDKMVGAGAIRDLDNKAVKAIMEKGGMKTSGLNAVEKYKNEVAMRVATYFDTAARIGINEPGAKEKAQFINRGFTKDTKEGMFFSLLSQFKTYPLTMASQMWDFTGKLGPDQGSATSYAKNLAPFIATSIAYGAIGVALRSILSNEKPENPFHLHPLLEAAAKGGGLGMTADLIRDNYTKKPGSGGRSFLAGMAGPVLGQLDDVAAMGSDIKNAITGETPSRKPWKDVGMDAFNMVNSNIPRVPIVSQVIKQNVTDQMKEAMSPGYIQRSKNRARARGQEPIIGQ